MTSCAGALVIVVLAVIGWNAVIRTVVLAPIVQALGAFLVVWVPLLAAIALAARAARRGGTPFIARPFFRPIDVLWGAGVGFLARGAAAGIEIAITGRMSGTGALIEPEPSTVWLVFIVAPLIVGPVIEETFFRGTLLPAVRGAALANGARPTTSAAVAVAVSALLFALLHTLDATSPTLAFVAGASSFVFGLGASLLTVFTGRLGGAIIAHVVFNGLLVALVLG
ncbi:CPBP family intramembrane metalloprotease [Agromyces protaetiae]|uniref:CPBP family intramembrane metalloprotease n=1 Tax=Agromyces protaetiae TaxID=2509455 RepID=A0A4P6FF05_9MICO|nr:CPBP family intramembrane glutamic endopeptidase [Agromyces protaetiae]QAY74722.1 CPBP family intramembrane metalloprotease [Agromyces protaetiae]